MKIEKKFYFRIIRWTSFLMTPLKFLYDEKIDRPKLTEQKKNLVEYIVPPSPLKLGRNNKNIQKKK